TPGPWSIPPPSVLSGLRRQVLMDRHEVVRLPPGLREPPRQKFVKGLQFLQPPVLTCPHFAQISPQFYKPGISLCFRAPLPSQDLVDFGQNEQSPFAIEL